MKFNAKIPAFLILIIFSVVLASGCINQPKEEPITLTTITKDGVAYEFTNNIFDAMKVPMIEQAEIKRIVTKASAVSIVFNSSSKEENAYLTVINYNMVGKLSSYYTYSKQQFVDETFYNIYDVKNDRLMKFDRSINNWTESPTGIDNIEWPILYLKGPNTGANETSVTLDESGKIIYIQGTDYRNFSLAADRFTLEILGVNLDLLNEGKRDFS
ncbi:MAG: hypothetical protein HZB67_03855 [Candidatus Aenigmarchaeota archaeon]|nr:hypothetical protein [Candidatus Aenigmarchaeota archaeon]